MMSEVALFELLGGLLSVGLAWWLLTVLERRVDRVLDTAQQVQATIVRIDRERVVGSAVRPSGLVVTYRLGDRRRQKMVVVDHARLDDYELGQAVELFVGTRWPHFVRTFDEPNVPTHPLYWVSLLCAVMGIVLTVVGVVGVVGIVTDLR
jgi:hypothetical protein